MIMIQYTVCIYILNYISLDYFFMCTTLFVSCFPGQNDPTFVPQLWALHLSDGLGQHSTRAEQRLSAGAF